tara:strand:+ start:3884 stop:5470 length:1587 start_codon:yes stop_codon:yes gene_type:complete
MTDDKVSFAIFFAVYAEAKGWDVPYFHYEMCNFLQETQENNEDAILEVFRGAAKSTTAGIYSAWTLYKDNTFRFLIQSADDDLATMMTRDTREVLLNHPLCIGMLTGKPAEHFFWIDASTDKRNPSMRANGIMSNTTGGRADEIIYDDVEVQKNVETLTLREKLRKRMGEGTHILTPKRRKLYIGTPHTEDSIYPELEAKGARILKIPLLKHNQRVDESEIKELKLIIPYDDLIAFHGNKVMFEDIDYKIIDGVMIFDSPMSGLIDLYSGSAWIERFDRQEIIKRRKDCLSLNEWDSQYMLRARSLYDSRLNPLRLVAYNHEPVFTKSNDSLRCTLNEEPILTMKCYWDVALGKIKSDDSVLTVLLQNTAGHYFWHRAQSLKGDIHKQCEQIRKTVEALKIPHIIVETAGTGGTVPAILRKALMGTGCTVGEKHPTEQKNKRIINAIEAPLSGGFLYAHESIMNGEAYTQMRDWNPMVTDQNDDYLDSLAGAILSSPIRLGGRMTGIKGETFRGFESMTSVEYVGSFQ